MSGSELIQLQNGLYIEVQAPPDDQSRQISASQAKRVQAAMDEVRGLLLKAVEPVASLWDEMNRDLQIDNVEIELGLGFEAQGNFLSRLGERVPDLAPRLPTEAEWEYGCRAGTDTPFWFGDSLSTDQANFDGSYQYRDGPKGEYRQQTVDVKALPCNGWGLFQMHGNVWEWCSDWYRELSTDDAVDPQGAKSGGWRVVRGGCWVNDAWSCRSARRAHGVLGFRADALGFRLARDG